MTEDTSITDDLYRPPERIDDYWPQPLPGELLRDFLLRMIHEEPGMATFFEWCMQ